MKLPKKIVDANVILRFFLRDDEEQFGKAKAFLQRLEIGRDEALLTEIVFAEIIWVLSKVYGIPRNDIADKFSQVISYKGVKTILDKGIFLESLKSYSHHSMDIQDIFLANIASEHDSSIVTFDKSDFKKLHCPYSEP